MKSEAFADIEDLGLEESRAEYRKWVESLAILFDSIFSEQKKNAFSDPTDGFAHSKELIWSPVIVSEKDIDRLCSEFETVYEYAKHAEVRIGSTFAKLEEIKSILNRFLAIGRITWMVRSVHVDDSERGKPFQLDAQFQRFLMENVLNEELWPWDRSACVLVGKATNARLELDLGPWVSLPSIATLAKMDERSVLNATAIKRPESRLMLNEEALSHNMKVVDQDKALRWLEGRRKFKKTISADSENTVVNTEKEEAGFPFQVQHFVPVANDASYFDPVKCKSPNGYYTIGGKGNEEKYDDFLDALAELQQTPKPRWRRPNPNGHFGIVTGVSWKRLSATDLGVGDLASGEANLAKFFEED